MRILVIEDEPRIAEQVAKALRKNDFSTDIAGSLEDAGYLIQSETYDAIVADRMLPDGDSALLIEDLRGNGHDIPILMLTAKDAVGDRIYGLEAGADDYLVKPFAMSELIARVRALLRRPGSVFGKIEKLGSLSFDFNKRAASVGGEPLSLPRPELVVLEQLVHSAGRVVTKEDLLDKVYGLDIPESNTIPVHIHNLRQKLKKLDAGIEIHTFRGLGYMIGKP